MSIKVGNYVLHAGATYKVGRVVGSLGWESALLVPLQSAFLVPLHGGPEFWMYTNSVSVVSELEVWVKESELESRAEGFILTDLELLAREA